ncbi:MAG: histidine--tRNA ligase [Actinomycetota bacterium]|nr:histidine--tRNA ligase [Actinomycetota bacterium]
MPEFRSPAGTHDVLPPESARWQALIASFAATVGRAGYGLVVSPMFEEVGVFARLGEGTDVVGKEMYDFRDKADRHLALRPEGTASVVRAWAQHRPPLPFKAWYAAPNFRYERAQAGRYRQHHQVGVEVLGPTDADLDVEVVNLAVSVVATLGLGRVELLVNSLGDHVCRPGYTATLAAFLDTRRDQLCDEHRERALDNPLRVLDCKRPACVAATDDAPRSIDHLCGPCREHFARVREGLNFLDVDYRIETRLVRGLDYYTRTTFELVARALESAQNAVGGGDATTAWPKRWAGRPPPASGSGWASNASCWPVTPRASFPHPPAPWRSSWSIPPAVRRHSGSPTSCGGRGSPPTGPSTPAR